MPKPRRLMLDVNLWSRMGDQGTATQFHQAAALRGDEIVVPPGMLQEIARNPNLEVSARHVGAILSGEIVQLATESELMDTELAKAIGVHRPDWLTGQFDWESVRRYHQFYTRGMWRAARRNWPALVAELRGMQPRYDPVAANLERQRELKKSMTEWGVLLEAEDLKMTPGDEVNDWVRDNYGGRSMDAWRVILWQMLLTQLDEFFTAMRNGDPKAWQLQGSTRADWLRVTVNVDAMFADQRGFATFWLEQVRAEEIPRSWLAWACWTIQLKSKVTAGNAADIQHATHLPDCDVFLTGDGPLARTLHSVVGLAPFPLPPVLHVDMESDNMSDAIYAALEAH